ncbi:MAG: DUF3560 domain-containing protein [Planctomycetota bacterium]|jgi:hypothetical protein
MAWIPILYPKADESLITTAEVAGRPYDDREAARRALARQVRTAQQKNLSLTGYLVEVDGGRKAVTVEEATGRKVNPDGKPDVDLEIRFAKEVWKSKPKELDEGTALRGIIRRTKLERKAVQKVVDEAKPKPKVVLTEEQEEERRKKRLERNLKAKWAEIAEERPSVAALTVESALEVQDRVRALIDKADFKPADVRERMDKAVDGLLEGKKIVDDAVQADGLEATERGMGELRKHDDSWQTQQMGRLVAELSKAPLPEVEVAPDAPKPTTTTIGEVTAIRGEDTLIYYPQSTKAGGVAGLGKEPAFYALVPQEGVIQSHDPWSFAENDAYIRECQERDYARDTLEQAKVIRHTGAFQPKLVLSTNPDAINGPPIIDRAGIVLGGNSRIMTMKRVLKEKPEFYVNAMRTEIGACGEFGLRPTDAAPGMILCRVVKKVLSPEECPVMSRNLNRAMTKELGAAAKAVSLGGMLPKSLFDLLGDELMAADTTVNAILDKRSKQVLKLLQDSGVVTEQNLVEFVKAPKGRPSDRLSIEGRQAIRNAVMGALVGDKEHLALTTDRLENLYERLAPLVMGLEDAGEYDLRAAMRTAIAAVSLFASRGPMEWRQNFETRSLEFEAEAKATPEDRLPELFANPTAAILATWLVEAQATPRIAYEAMRAYVKGIPGRGAQTALIEADTTPGELLKSALGSRWSAVNITPGQVAKIGVDRWLAGLTTTVPEPEAVRKALPEPLAEAYEKAPALEPEPTAEPAPTAVDPTTLENEIIAAWQAGRYRRMHLLVEDLSAWLQGPSGGEWGRFQTKDAAQAWVDEQRDVAEAEILRRKMGVKERPTPGPAPEPPAQPPSIPGTQREASERIRAGTVAWPKEAPELPEAVGYAADVAPAEPFKAGPELTEWTEKLGEKAEKERKERLKAESKRKKGLVLDTAAAAKLRKLADGMQKTIDAKLDPGSAHQSPTARRARMAASSIQQGENLQKLQGCIRAMAGALEAGDLPEILGQVNTRALMEDLRVYAAAPLDTGTARLKDTADEWRDAPGTYAEDVPEYQKVRAIIQGSGEYGSSVWLGEETRDFAVIGAFVTRAKKEGVEVNRWLMDDLRQARRIRKAGLGTRAAWAKAREAFQEVCERHARPVDPEQARLKKRVELETELVGRKIPGYFPTPNEIVEKMVDAADIQPGMKVLEPSAGHGAIAEVIRRRHPDAQLDVIEFNATLREVLRNEGFNLVGQDFLEFRARDYDRIIMNPPFEKGQDMEHVNHAFSMLKGPGSRVVALMSEGAFFRQGPKERSFRDWLNSDQVTIKDTWDLPEGAFLKSRFRTTGVKARMLVLDWPVPRHARAPVAESDEPGDPVLTPVMGWSGRAVPRQDAHFVRDDGVFEVFVKRVGGGRWAALSEHIRVVPVEPKRGRLAALHVATMGGETRKEVVGSANLGAYTWWRQAYEAARTYMEDNPPRQKEPVLDQDLPDLAPKGEVEVPPTVTEKQVERVAGAMGQTKLGPKQLAQKTAGYNDFLAGKPRPAQTTTANSWYVGGWLHAQKWGADIPDVFVEGPEDADVTVTHSAEEGSRIQGETRRVKETIKALGRKGGGFWKWSRNLGAWCRPQSRGRRFPTTSLFYVKQVLEEHGHATVRVEVDVSATESEARAVLAEHKRERADVYAERARRARGRAEAFHQRAHDISERFAGGQPILVGHHSEKRARADRARMDTAMRKGIEESGKAAHASGRAERLEREAAVLEAEAAGRIASNADVKAFLIALGRRLQGVKKALGAKSVSQQYRATQQAAWNLYWVYGKGLYDRREGAMIFASWNSVSLGTLGMDQLVEESFPGGDVDAAYALSERMLRAYAKQKGWVEAREGNPDLALAEVEQLEAIQETDDQEAIALMGAEVYGADREENPSYAGFVDLTPNREKEVALAEGAGWTAEYIPHHLADVAPEKYGERQHVRVVAPAEEKVGLVVLEGRYGGALVHRSVRRPGMWQLSWLGSDGTPWGHNDHETLQSAVDEARRDGNLVSMIMDPDGEAHGKSRVVNPAGVVEAYEKAAPRAIRDYQIAVHGDGSDDVADKIARGIQGAADICQADPPVCVGNLGIPREDMPQLPKGPMAEFLKHWRESGVKVEHDTMHVGDLRATQRDILAQKVVGMARSAVDGNFPAIKAPVVVSNDNYILDGHHRWAALMVLHPDNVMAVTRVDAPIQALLDQAAQTPGVQYRGLREYNPDKPWFKEAEMAKPAKPDGRKENAIRMDEWVAETANKEGFEFVGRKGNTWRWERGSVAITVTREPGHIWRVQSWRNGQEHASMHPNDATEASAFVERLMRDTPRKKNPKKKKVPPTRWIYRGEVRNKKVWSLIFTTTKKVRGRRRSVTRAVRVIGPESTHRGTGYYVDQTGAVGSVWMPWEYWLGPYKSSTAAKRAATKAMQAAQWGKAKPGREDNPGLEHTFMGREANASEFDFKGRVAQSLQFPKTWDPVHVLNWAEKHGAVPLDVDVTDNYFRLRLVRPTDVNPTSYGTLRLPNGVLVTYATPKRRANPAGLVPVAQLIAAGASALGALKTVAL